MNRHAIIPILDAWGILGDVARSVAREMLTNNVSFDAAWHTCGRNTMHDGVRDEIRDLVVAFVNMCGDAEL
jgi:hypothetical protein